ncbi:MAG: hypothetical protein AAFP98_09745 [Pseudomonadota bacterium]
MDKTILAQKLAALSAGDASFANGLRVISDGVEPTILSAMLSEVDMTVLPRKLTFKMADSEITLVAGGRRLRGLVKASKDIKGVIGVLGKPLSRDDTELLDGLRGILDQFTATAGQLTVVSDEPDAMGGQTDAGVTAAALAEVWAVELNTAPQSPLQQFIRDCGEMADAWVVMADDTETTYHGDGAKLDALKKAVSEQWDTFSGSVDQLTGESGMIALNNALGESGSLAIVKSASEAAIICYSSEKMNKIHEAWVASKL